MIDVRGSEVYGRQHLAGAINIPLGELVQRQAELPRERDTPIFTCVAHSLEDTISSLGI